MEDARGFKEKRRAGLIHEQRRRGSQSERDCDAGEGEGEGEGEGKGRGSDASIYGLGGSPSAEHERCAVREDRRALRPGNKRPRSYVEIWTRLCIPVFWLLLPLGDHVRWTIPRGRQLTGPAARIAVARRWTGEGTLRRHDAW